MVENRFYRFGDDVEATIINAGSTTLAADLIDGDDSVASSSSRTSLNESPTEIGIFKANNTATMMDIKSGCRQLTSGIEKVNIIDTGGLAPSSPIYNPLKNKKMNNNHNNINNIIVGYNSKCLSLSAGGGESEHRDRTSTTTTSNSTSDSSSSTTSSSATTSASSNSFSNRNGAYSFSNNRSNRYNQRNNGHNHHNNVRDNNINRSTHYSNHYRGHYHHNPSFRGAAPAVTSTAAFELDGQIKYELKDPLTMPDFVFKTMSQTLKFNGHPWVPDRVDFINDYADIYEGLSAELEAFYQYMKPREEEEVIRRGTYFAITKSIKKIDKFNIEAVKYYGSFSSGTYLPVSDIDIVVYCRSDQVIEILSWIATRLFADGIINNTCQIITQSRIPLLKFYDSFTGFPINITVNTPHVMERAAFIREQIRYDSYQIKILYFLKFYLLQKNHNQVFYGGIGSYALSLMVIRYFQTVEVKETLKGCRSTMLAHLLFGFFKLYGDVDFVRKHVISVNGGGRFFPISQFSSFYHNHHNHNNPHHYYNHVHSEPKRVSVLTIEDHLDPHKNVSVGSYKSETILSGFSNVIKQLTNRDRRVVDKSIINNVMSVVDSFDSYRSIIRLQFENYFSENKSYGPSGFIRYDYDEFLNNRNTFGKRDLVFAFEKMDETSFETRLINSIPIGYNSLSNGVDGDLFVVGYPPCSVVAGVRQPYDYLHFFYDYPDYEEQISVASAIFFQTLSQEIITARQEDMTKSRQQHPQEYHNNSHGHFGGGNANAQYHQNGHYRNGNGGRGWYNTPIRNYNNHGGGGSHYNAYSRQGGGGRYNNQYNHQLNGYFSNSSSGNNSANSTPASRRSDPTIRYPDFIEKPIIRRRVTKKKLIINNNNDENCPNMENVGKSSGGVDENITMTSDVVMPIECQTNVQDQGDSEVTTSSMSSAETLSFSDQSQREGKKSDMSTTSTFSSSTMSSFLSSSLSSPVANNNNNNNKSKKSPKVNSRSNTPATLNGEERSELKTATNVLKEMLKIPTTATATKTILSSTNDAGK